MADVVIVPAIILGLIIGFIELLFVHADQSFSGSHWFGHGIHAAIFAIIFVFINMNVAYVLGLINVNIPFQEVAVQGLVALAAFIKIQGASAGAGKAVREKLWHTIVIVALITATPYIWPFLKPLCDGLIGGSLC